MKKQSKAEQENRGREEEQAIPQEEQTNAY